MTDDEVRSPNPGRARQSEIFRAGASGRRPSVPTSWASLVGAAERAMSPDAWAYVAGSAGRESTAEANYEAFDAWRLIPRMLRDVSERDLSIELFGRRHLTPLLASPIGVLELVDPDADLAIARAAGSLGITSIVSSQASQPMEHIAAAGAGPWWFQLYWSSEDALVESFVTRAEASGAEAIVVTLDPGQYTAILDGKNGGTGIGLIEVYDLDNAAASSLGNVSTRGFVGTGDDVLIGGLIIGPGDPSLVVVRGVGPSLSAAGIVNPLADPTLHVEIDTLVGTLDYGPVRVARGSMGYKHKAVDPVAMKASLAAPNFLLKIIPHVDGTPRICELVEYYLEDITIKGAWTGPAALDLHSHAMAPVAELPVREIVSGTHIIADLTLGLGKVIHDYLR